MGRMPRANRYHIPGLIWHITHRCHNKDFLLKFRIDRDRYRYWLWEAKKRYGLCLLNYMFTSNHIHLIVYDNGSEDVIEQSMQLAQGRIAQEFNVRTHRLGAFWQDRYHATAIQSHQHLRRCMTYVDMNMVRAGVVPHPENWPSAGYHEIQKPPERYRLLDLETCMQVLGISNHKELTEWQQAQVSAALKKPQKREECWTSAIAVGDHAYLTQIAGKLGVRARHREITEDKNGYILKEGPGAYRLNMDHKMDPKG